MNKDLYIKVQEEYHKMTKYETDEEGENGKVYDAQYDDKTGELHWVERTENIAYVQQIGKELLREYENRT